MNNSIDKYKDIIDMPHPVSVKHKRMSVYDRAAQFSPFAALTGHNDAIRETERITQERPELDEYAKAELNEKLKRILSCERTDALVTFTYFVPDDFKSGGVCAVCNGIIRKVDEYRHEITMHDNTIIPMEQIIKIDSDLL